MSEERREDRDHRDAQRLLRFLKAGSGTVEASSRRDSCVVAFRDRSPVSVSRDTVARLQSAGFVELSSAGQIHLTDKARRHLQAGRPENGSSVQDSRVLIGTTIVDETGSRPAMVNIAESPLGLLFRRKDKAGRPFLTRNEFDAGERLRADYTRGQIVPRMGASWQAAVASGRRDGSRGSVADLTDAALGARQRVDNALAAVGPELSGVLVDVCCFLKGLETVELERQWPARSAKIVLKTALSALARHYEPQRLSREKSSAPAILHWGATGYRPRLAADRQV